jgi:two-component system cell cycle sensor histidine kinase/response regulator CckA
MCSQANADFVHDLKVAFEEMDTAIFISDPHGRCLDINPQALSLTGYSRQELIGKDFFDHFQADDQAPSLHRDGFLQGKTVVAEGRLRHRDGSLLAVELRILKLSDGNFLETARDITEQKAEEETLRKNEELFRTAFDNAPTGMSIIAPDGVTYLAVNPLLCEMFGYTREEFLGRTIHLVTHPDDEALSNEWIRKKFNDEPCEPDLEKRYIHKDGHIIWGLVRAHWIRNDDGTHRMAIAHIQDITGRKEAEEERKKLQIQLAVAMEIARLGHWEYDSENDTFTFNDNFYRIFRTSAEKAGGYTMSSHEYSSRFIHPDDRHIVEQEIRKCLETSDPDFRRKIEHRILYDDGTTGYICVHYFIEKDEQGRTVKTYGINQDITDRKLAEEEHRKLEDQVRQAQKMESIGLLAGGVAHDYNNMLNVILGNAELAMRKLSPEDPLQSHLNAIFGAGNRSAAITRQLLAFARKQTISPVILDLNETVERMLKMVRQLIGENIGLIWIPKEDLWQIKMDPSQVDQILVNLCVNARDAISDVGKVIIETENVTFDENYCAHHAGFIPGAFVLLSVSDNGSGMRREVLEHIFEPFFTTKVAGQGSGLGLATTYGIVKQNNGFINAYSEPGKGTTIKVYLPHYEGSAEAIGPHSTPEAPLSRGETILLVEDEAVMMEVARVMLESLNYKVLAAASPNEAIDLSEHYDGKIDLLITDVVMPQMNGRELSTQLKTFLPDIKILFMSGYTANVIAHQGVLEEGINFIQKPFSMHDLAIKIRMALDNFSGLQL